MLTFLPLLLAASTTPEPPRRVEIRPEPGPDGRGWGVLPREPDTSGYAFQPRQPSEADKARAERAATRRDRVKNRRAREAAAGGWRQS